VRAGGEKKTTWLWTTIGASTQAYDFDSFRVFVWSQRHHHYETAYIERNLQGYAPVLLQEVEFSQRGKVKAAPSSTPAFRSVSRRRMASGTARNLRCQPPKPCGLPENDPAKPRRHSGDGESAGCAPIGRCARATGGDLHRASEEAPARHYGALVRRVVQ